MPVENLDKPLILIADDDATQRLLVEEYLSEDGYRVSGTGDGLRALEKARQQRPDLMILDLMMPRLDGFDLLSRVRNDEALRDLPMLVVTGSDDTVSIERALDLGANDFMTKPIKWPSLEYRVKYLLRNSRLETELRNARADAEMASQAKSTFLAAMSHELRTPLNTIIGFANALERGLGASLKQEEAREYLNDIKSSGAHILKTIEEILDISKAESGQVALDEASFDVADTIVDVARTLQPETTVALGVRTAEDLPLFYGDKGRIRQTLSKLMSNAMKLTPLGGRIDIDAHLDERQNLIIQITDTDEGVHPDDVTSGPAPFWQPGATQTRNSARTDLGVCLAAKIIELHGGRLNIGSQSGVGTTIQVLLPRERLVHFDRPAA